MTIIQTPLVSDASTDVQAGLRVYDASGNLNVSRSKVVKGGEPYVLFKEDNTAGLKLINFLPTAKTYVTEAIEQNPDIKINVDKLNESNASSVQEKNRVVMGSSAIQVSKDTVSIIRSPEIKQYNREIIDMFLKFMIKSLAGDQPKYRSNIMMLDTADNLLRIVAHYNMDGDPDRNFKIEPNAGGAGRALERDNMEIVDLTRYDHAYYNIDSTRVWKGMRSLFSIPIHDIDESIIGVLNIDTDKNIVDTKFYDSHFQSCVGIATDILGRQLMISDSHK